MKLINPLIKRGVFCHIVSMIKNRIHIKRKTMKRASTKRHVLLLFGLFFVATVFKSLVSDTFLFFDSITKLSNTLLKGFADKNGGSLRLKMSSIVSSYLFLFFLASE